ncbi:SMC-Scp complex subunit ScpB [Pseudomonadota bacterium]
MNKSKNELKLIVEAALFASEVPLKVGDLIKLFPHKATPERDEIKTVLKALQQDYKDRGIELRRVGKAWRFQSCEKYSPWLRKLHEGRSPRYSRALLETLSIIAYRQPVTRGDIEEIRGVTVSSETMKTLLDREWVKQVGQREVAGRPSLFGTTQKFLEYFNLNSLSELPPLMDKREPEEIALELNLRLPLEETVPEMMQEDDTGESDSQKHSAEIIPLNPAAERPRDLGTAGETEGLEPDSTETSDSKQP